MSWTLPSNFPWNKTHGLVFRCGFFVMTLFFCKGTAQVTCKMSTGVCTRRYAALSTLYWESCSLLRCLTWGQGVQIPSAPDFCRLTARNKLRSLKIIRCLKIQVHARWDFWDFVGLGSRKALELNVHLSFGPRNPKLTPRFCILLPPNLWIDLNSLETKCMLINCVSENSKIAQAQQAAQSRASPASLLHRLPVVSAGQDFSETMSWVKGSRWGSGGSSSSFWSPSFWLGTPWGRMCP